jgi:hypothetical protein
VWLLGVLLLPPDIVGLGSGFNLFVRNGNGNQLREVIVAMIRLKLLQCRLKVGRSIGIVDMVIIPSRGFMAKCLDGAVRTSVQRRVS